MKKMKSKKRRAMYRRLIERDGGERCHYCGDGPPDYFEVHYSDGSGRRVTRLQIDHKVPISEGGRHDLSNLVLACQPCNSRKGAKPYDDFVAARIEP